MAAKRFIRFCFDGYRFDIQYREIWNGPDNEDSIQLNNAEGNSGKGQAPKEQMCKDD